MPELPLDLRRGNIQAQSGPRAQASTAYGQGVKDIGRGIMDIASAMDKKHDAEQSMLKQKYWNEIQLQGSKVKASSIDRSKPDGSDLEDIFKEDYDMVIDGIEVPDGLTEKSKQEVMLQSEKLRGSMNIDMSNAAISRRHDHFKNIFVENNNAALFNLIENPSGPNFSLYKGQLFGNLNNLSEALNIEDDRFQQIFDDQVEKASIAFLEARGQRSIGDALATLEDIKNGKIDGVADVDISKMDADTKLKISSKINSYLMSSGNEITANANNMLNTFTGLVKELRSPDVEKMQETAEQQASILDMIPGMQHQAAAVRQKAFIATVQADVTDRYGRADWMTLTETIDNTESQLQAGSDLDPLSQSEASKSTQVTLDTLNAIKAQRIEDSHNEWLRTDPNARTMVNNRNALARELMENDRLTTAQREGVEAQLEAESAKIANASMAWAQRMLGDSGLMEFEGKEQLKMTHDVIRTLSKSGNSDELQTFFAQKQSNYPGVAWSHYISQTFNTPEMQKWITVDGVRQSNPAVWSEMVQADARFKESREIIGSSNKNLLQDVINESLGDMAKTFPKGTVDQTLLSLNEWAVKLATGRLATTDGDIDEIAAQAVTDVIGQYTPLHETVLIDNKTLYEKPGIDIGVDTIREFDTTWKNYILDNVSTNQISPGLDWTEEQKNLFLDQDLIPYTSDDGTGVMLLMGNKKQPVLDNDGKILIVPFNVLNTFGNVNLPKKSFGVRFKAGTMMRSVDFKSARESTKRILDQNKSFLGGN